MQIARVTAVSFVLLAASLVLAGCGRKGDPDYPQGTPMDTQTKADGSTKKTPKKPTRPFVLDGLLN